MTGVFVDGSAGTTGLRIFERLKNRADIELITLSEELRKDVSARRDAINSADVVFLCLPDAAAIEAAALADNGSTVIIDTSTAHRTSDDWAYGFPEIKDLREKICTSKRIANPGCHASGFISLVAPLVQGGLIKKDALLSCFSLTGYSGGGKKMIADYAENGAALLAPRMYGLSQQHKHLPEMAKICGLESAPLFSPIVSSYYAGMQVTVPLFANQVEATLDEIKAFYADYYTGAVVKFADAPDENGFLSAAKLADDDGMQVSVYGCDDRILLVSSFDNLGKGASGAAIQNMNIVLAVDETTGLNLGRV